MRPAAYLRRSASSPSDLRQEATQLAQSRPKPVRRQPERKRSFLRPRVEWLHRAVGVVIFVVTCVTMLQWSLLPGHHQSRVQPEQGRHGQPSVGYPKIASGVGRVAFLVLTQADQYQARTAIRETWGFGRHLRFLSEVSHYSTRLESFRHGDIEQVSFNPFGANFGDFDVVLDSFLDQAPSAWLFVTTDDRYVNVERLESLVRPLEAQRNIIISPTGSTPLILTPGMLLSPGLVRLLFDESAAQEGLGHVEDLQTKAAPNLWRSPCGLHCCVRSHTDTAPIAGGPIAPQDLHACFQGDVGPKALPDPPARHYNDASEPRVNFPTSALKFVVLVVSSRDGFERRSAIRETWGRGFPNVFFLVGMQWCRSPPQLYDYAVPCRRVHKPRMTWEEARDDELALQKFDRYHAGLQEKLLDEHSAFGDMLLLDVMDAYGNLAEKVLEGIVWASKFDPDWIMKVDDDAVVRLREFQQYLEEFDRDADLASYRLTGFPFFDGQVENEGKWQDHKFRRPFFPPYPNGASGYAISRAVHSVIVQNRASLPLFHNEDTCLGIWMDQLGLAIDFAPTRAFLHTCKDARCCDDSNYFVYGHYFGAEAIRECCLRGNIP